MKGEDRRITVTAWADFDEAPPQIHDNSSLGTKREETAAFWGADMAAPQQRQGPRPATTTKQRRTAARSS